MQYAIAAEPITSASETVRYQLAQSRQPAGQGGAAAGQQEPVEAFQSKLFGGDLVALPGTPDPATGQRVWEVTIQKPNGLRVETTTHFTGQLGPEQFGPDTPLKAELKAKLEAAEARADKQFVQDVVASITPHFFAAGWEPGRTAGRGEQILVASDLSGFHFKSHGRVGFDIAGLPVHLVEAISYAPFKENGHKITGRELGLGVTKTIEQGWFAGARISVNVRGLDMNHLGSIPDSGKLDPSLRLNVPTDAAALHGASATVTVEAMPQALERIGEAIQGKNVKLRAAALTLERAGKLVDTFDGAVGFAWQGKLLWNPETEQLYVKFGELEAGIPVHSLFSQTEALAEILPSRNHGHPEVARANAIEALLRGENPYAHAAVTRAEGESRNHGLYTTDIANRILEIARFIEPGRGTDGYAVRTNAQAASVLQTALVRDQHPHVPPEYLELVPEARADAREALTPYQSARLHETLAMLEVNGIAGLFGDEVASAARDAAARLGDRVPFDAAEQAFVKDVFEGQFRRGEPNSPAGRLATLVANLSGPVSVALGILHGGELGDSAELLRLRGGQSVGLHARLESFGGGVLEALDIDPDVAATPAERFELEQLGVQAVRETLTEQRHGVPNAESLYADFVALTDAQRAEIGREAVAAFERAREPVAVPRYNAGDADAAVEWNFQAYRRGENPYQLAMYSRSEDGGFRNHGDPVLDIAGRLIRIHDAVGLRDGADDFVRTNREAGNGLGRAIEMYRNGPADPAYERFVDPAADSGGPRLTPEQARLLESTLVLMDEYGIAGLYGRDVAAFAAELNAQGAADVPVQSERGEFVQKVFEGFFRRQHMD